MKLRRLSSLLVAVFLQVSPLAKNFQPVLAGVLQPLAVLLRFASAASALAGGAHALSAATGLVSASQVRATNGVPFSYRVQITSDQYGAAKSYSASGLTTIGLKFSNITLGTVSGSPNAATLGVKKVTFTGWEHSNLTGHSYSTDVFITVVGGVAVITQQPTSQVATEGDTVTLSVTATSTDAPAYQWIRNGIEVAAATSPSLVFAPVRTNDAGSYTCRIQNSGGVVVSAPAVLTVNPAAKPPVIGAFTAVTPVALHQGEPLSLSVSATAGSPLAYAWFRGANPVPGATQSTLVVPGVSQSDAGLYRVAVTANGLTTQSSTIAVTVAPPLAAGTVTEEPGGTRVAFGAVPGRHYFLEAAATPGSRSWQAVADVVAPQAAASLTDPSASPGDLRFYRLRVQ